MIRYTRSIKKCKVINFYFTSSCNVKLRPLATKSLIIAQRINIAETDYATAILYVKVSYNTPYSSHASCSLDIESALFILKAYTVRSTGRITLIMRTMKKTEIDEALKHVLTA